MHMNHINFENRVLTYANILDESDVLTVQVSVRDYFIVDLPHFHIIHCNIEGDACRQQDV